MIRAALTAGQLGLTRRDHGSPEAGSSGTVKAGLQTMFTTVPGQVQWQRGLCPQVTVHITLHVKSNYLLNRLTVVGRSGQYQSYIAAETTGVLADGLGNQGSSLPLASSLGAILAALIGLCLVGRIVLLCLVGSLPPLE